MKLLSRYILRQIAVPAALALTVVAVVGVANEIQERVGSMPVAQMTLGDMSKLTLFLLPTLVAYVVPITFMLGILFAFGRLSRHGEIVAIQAAGVPLKRLILPVIMAGLLLSGACFIIQDRLQPWGMTKIYKLIFSDLPLRVTLDTLPTGIMQEYAGWRVYVGGRDRKTGTLHGLVVLKPEGDGSRVSSYYAERARLVKEDGKTWLEMENGHFVPAGKGKRVTRLSFDRPFRVSVPEITVEEPPRNRRSMTIAELYGMQLEEAKRLAETYSESDERELRKKRDEIAERLSLPFACLAVSLAAAPLGARAKRSGRSYTFAVGFSIILMYYVLRMLCDTNSLCSMAEAIARAWAPNLAIGFMGLVFIWRVDRV